jgi:pimeloyl-ACP methyl ester carboxylesterase
VTRRLLIILPALAALTLVIALAVLHPPGPPQPPHRFAMGHGSTIALLHGPGGSIQDWLPTARRLAQSHRVVLIELPGHGLSPFPGALTPERAAEALDATLAEESKEPVVLVGHALGGLIAALEAAEHPERVRAVVLVETALKPQVAGDEVQRRLDEIDHDYPRAVRETYMAYGRDSLQGEKLYQQASAVGAATLAPWLKLELFADISLRMRHLRPPLLAVFSERTWPADKSWDEVGPRLGYPSTPNARAMRIDGCGHFPMLDRPEDLSRIIGHFADDSSKGPVAER